MSQVMHVLDATARLEISQRGMSEQPAQRRFIAVMALLFGAGVAVTIAWCKVHVGDGRDADARRLDDVRAWESQSHQWVRIERHPFKTGAIVRHAS
jgi:hypothetical protein